ncbi:MAG: quinone-dependent dihydroorotate dehydrogenase, partial [Bdellovibrionia bacterium]
MKPWLWLPAQQAHDWAPSLINLYASFSGVRDCNWRQFEWRGMKFRNRLGIAGGVDKDGLAFQSWIKLGAGFVEVGTVTPKPQGPNTGPTVGRDIDNRALWNKLGFPSRGAEFVKKNLAGLTARSNPGARDPVPVFVNIGKNRETKLEDAGGDYASLVREFTGIADTFVVNISSPNTQDLRNLQGREYLSGLLKQVLAARTDNTPVLLKLSPDLTDGELEEILNTSLEEGIDGWILTNTTRERPSGIDFPKDGGLSGAPLGKQSRICLEKTVKILGPRRGGRLIVSAGGVMSATDVSGRLELGADLVQVYSALIFSGPRLFGDIARILRYRK